LGHTGEALSELSRAIARSPDVAYLLAVDAPRPRAARRAAQAIAASAGSFELLRVLLRDEPELHLWLRERDAKARPRSRRTAAAPAAESKAPRRLGAGSPPRLSGPRPLRARPPAVPREDQQAAAPKPADARLRLKVTLLGTRPPIWRRLEVAGTLTLPRFHHVLQAAMGWTDSHLHMFIAGRTHYSDPSYELDIPMRSERGAKLGALLRRRGDRIDYEYDFG
jgi:hypothetical protein